MIGMSPMGISAVSQIVGSFPREPVVTAHQNK